MTATNNKASERRGNEPIDEIEALLPWHAAGTLSRREAQRVEDALSRDQELARRYAMARQELAETIHLNETLGAPSSRAMEKLMAGIEAEGSAGRRPRLAFNVSTWIAERISQFSPRTLAWSAAAAVLAIVLQAGLLTGLFVGEHGRGSSYQTASAPQQSEIAVGFAPQATAADITRFLETYHVSVVEGPVAGGLYKLRSVPAGSKEDIGNLVKRMQQETKVVRLVAPTE